MSRTVRTVSILLVVTATLSIAGRESGAQTWAERLQFPRGQKVVLLDAREMGLSWEMNQAGIDLFKDGRIQALTGVPTGPWFNDFVQQCKEHGVEDVGIAIALTNPFEKLSWRFASSRSEVPSLVNQDGFPWRTVLQYAVNATPEDVKTEIHAQIERARSAGLQISHLSSYHGTAYSRADTAAAFLEASRKYWIPAPVVELTPEHLHRFRTQGYPLDDNLVELVRSYPLPKMDDLQIVPDGPTYEEKRDLFCDLLVTMKPGLTTFMLRPAVSSAGLPRLGNDWQQRVWDAQLMMDPKVKSVMEEQQVVVTSWREIMQRFEGVPVDVELKQIEAPQESNELE